MLAAKFVEAEIKTWLEEDRPNLQNPLDYLPILARKIVENYEIYRKMVGAKDCACAKQPLVGRVCRHGNWIGDCKICSSYPTATSVVPPLREATQADYDKLAKEGFPIPSGVRPTVPLNPKFDAMAKQVEYNVGYSCPDLDQDFSDFNYKDNLDDYSNQK